MSGLYRPLTTLSYLVNYAGLGNGSDPAGYHYFNLTLHLVNTGLAYLISLEIFAQLPLAFAAAALWSLHPIQTEAVTNVVGRADMLAAFGVMGTLFCYLRAVRSPGWKSGAWVAALAVFAAIGISAKESGIAAAAVIPLYDFVFAPRISWRKRVAAYAAAIVPCIGFLALRGWVLAQSPSVPFPFVDNPMTGASFLGARLTAWGVMVKYLGLLIWPARLSYDYSYSEIPLFAGRFTNWFDWQAVLGLAVCAAALWGAIAFRRRNRPLCFFALMFFVAFAPVSNLLLIIGTVMGERLFYLPSLACVACAAWVGGSLLRRMPGRVAAAGLAVALVALAARTHVRNEDWASAGRFWASGLESAPGSYKTNVYFAKTMLDFPVKNWSAAAAAADRSLAILDPLPPLQNVGAAYRDAAETYLAAGDAHVEGSPEHWYAKAREALERSQQIELAKDVRDRQINAARGLPGYTHIPSVLYLQLGVVYTRLNDPVRALAAFETGRALDPNAELLERLGEAYAAAGQPRNAARAMIEAMELDPALAGLAVKLAELYRAVDSQSCAGNQEGLDMQCPMVHSDICGAARNIIAGYARGRQNFAASDVRRSAMSDLGCTAEDLR